ncbi:hypothetical protein GF325_14045 [Candidatus Bathyarchaeota archaeon]|nr:hypothetical protein [Candidatus Bathyarchaeota archaeon]
MDQGHAGQGPPEPAWREKHDRRRRLVPSKARTLHYRCKYYHKQFLQQ